ncbi:MAG: FG-GAP-like repeat-containing protein [Phycisphaerales bacterium]
MKHTTSFTIFIATTLCALTSSALATNGVAAIWGTDYYGQATVPNWLGACSQISAGTTHTLAVDANGLVKAWGNNAFGQCTVPYFQYPIVQIAAGDGHSMALQSQIPTQSTTNVKCWGNNTFGQCTIPGSLGNTTKIAAGFYHSLAIKNNGTVIAWGDNRWNQSSVPTSSTGAPLLGTCIQIACGFAHSLAIQSDGTVKAWGAGTTNTGTNPELGQSMVPTNLGACTQVAAGGLFSVALKANGTVVTWGNTWASVPTNLGACTAIAAGNSHAVAIQSTGNIVAWGDNTYGQCNVINHGSALRISANTYNTAAIQTDPCDADGNGTLNADEAGAATSTWLFPNITSTFENPANWSNGIPGYNTDAKISGNPQITFDCSNSVKTLELSTGSSNWNPGLSLNLNSHSLTVNGGRFAFTPGAGSYMPYSVNVSGGYVYNGAPNDTLPLIFESDHATWNINNTSVYSNRIELATLSSSSIELDLSSSNLYTHSVTTSGATGGSHHIQLLNSGIVNFNEIDPLVIGSDMWISLKGMMDGDYDYSSNTIGSWSAYGTVFQKSSLLDAWGNLSFQGSLTLAGQINLHTFASAYNGRSKMKVQGGYFEYGANTSASAFAVMNVFGNNFNAPTCAFEDCDTGMIQLQLNAGGLASVGGPLFIYSTDNSIPAEGNVYTLISLDPTYAGAFDPNNNKFSSVRWAGQNGEGLQNGLTFEQILSSNKLQLQCVRAPIVEPAPTNTTNLASVPFASASADFTNDGRDDVVNLIVGASNSVQIMKDMGDGTFAQLRTFALPAGATPNAIAAGNVVGDSTPEIAVTSIVSGAGVLTLYNATGTVLWTRAMDAGELPTCVCMLAPTVTGGTLGKVAVGTQKIAGTGFNFALVNPTGNVKSVSGDNSSSQNTPVDSVPRTVHGSDIDDDDLTDVTAAGSTSAASLTSAPVGFIQVVRMTTNGPQANTPQYLNYVPVSIATGDIDGDGVKDIFASCNAIPSSIPASTRPVACFLRGSISAASGMFTMSTPTGISVGRPVQGKAIALVKRNGGFSLAVASTDGVNDSVDVIELNAFTNGSLSIGNQTPISTGGTVIGLRTLKDQGTQKFATVRNVTGLTAGAVIESTGYVERMYGDFDGSGTIDTGDISFMLLSFGEPGITDLDGSGNTDTADVSLLLLLFS